MANLERYRSWIGLFLLCVFALDQSSTSVKRLSTRLDGALMSMLVCLRSGILKWPLRCVFYVIPATENGLPSISAVVIVICGDRQKTWLLIAGLSCCTAKEICRLLRSTLIRTSPLCEPLSAEDAGISGMHM